MGLNQSGPDRNSHDNLQRDPEGTGRACNGWRRGTGDRRLALIDTGEVGTQITDHHLASAGSGWDSGAVVHPLSRTTDAHAGGHYLLGSECRERARAVGQPDKESSQRQTIA